VAAARAASGDDRRGRRRDRTCASGSRDRPTGSATGVDRDEDRRTRPRCPRGRGRGHLAWGRPSRPRLFTHSLPRSCRTAFTTPAAQVFQVEKGDRPAAGELRERAVPALDRLVLDEERREGLLQELVRLGLRLGLDQRRLCVPLGLGDLRLREGLLALQLVLRLLGLLLGRHLLLHWLPDRV